MGIPIFNLVVHSALVRLAIESVCCGCADSYLNTTKKRLTLKKKYRSLLLFLYSSDEKCPLACLF